MNKSIMELLSEVSGADLLLAFILILAFSILILTQKNRISKLLNKWRKTKNEEDDFHSLVYDLKDSIDKLSEKVNKNQENRDKELLKYRDDSRKIRDEMYRVINEQSQTIRHQSKDIKELTKIIVKMQEKNSETKRAEIKEKIERIYRECTGGQMCTEMQFESLRDLITQYEKHGGDNSFVHSIVEKEMYKWQVISSVKEGL